MFWNRNKDNQTKKEGGFTFKGGGFGNGAKQDDFSSIKPFKLNAKFNDTKPQSPAEILYGKNSKTNQDNAIKKERNDLLNKLGNKLTNKEILYSSIDELKGKAKEKIMQSPTLQKGTEFAIGNNHNKLLNNLIKKAVGKDTAGMLDIAHGEKMTDKSYLKDSIELKNYDDPFVKNDKEYLKNKVEQQFKDYDFNKEDIKGYYFKNNSEPSQRISKNPDFKEILKKNKDKIIKGENFTGRFEKHGPVGILNDNDLKNAIGGFDIRNSKFDKEGNLHLKIYDTYDFNKNANDFLNKAGRHEMEAGNLKPYFSIHDIMLSKDEIDEIFK